MMAVDDEKKMKRSKVFNRLSLVAWSLVTKLEAGLLKTRNMPVLKQSRDWLLTSYFTIHFFL